ncbi:MAG: sigma-70 family RNA polymerase sigma factor [Planctomycetes bacterium]|nr:sigma-70 family RNA polymerase sigma factor [Planctomycetota bacterium]
MMVFSSSIRTLIYQAKAGDKDAFGRAFESCSDLIESFIRRELGSALAREVEAMEILDETFLRASRSLHQLRGEDERSLVAWLRAIAANVIKDEGRRLKAQKKVETSKQSPIVGSSAGSASLLDYLRASCPSPSEILTRRERLVRLGRALQTLKEDHRDVIVLVWLKGLPVKDVARLMGRSPEATSQLLYRALLKLKEAFGETSSLRLPRDERLDEVEE